MTELTMLPTQHRPPWEEALITTNNKTPSNQSKLSIIMTRLDLWSAARDDDVTAVDYLVGPDGGNKVDELDDFGRSSLHVAVTYG